MDEPEYTHSEQIMSYQLPAFFEELHNSHAGKPVNVERDGDLVLEGPITDWVTLQSIRYYQVRKGYALYIETKWNSSQAKYMFKAPVLVWVVRDQRRQVVAVQAIDEKGRNIIMRFAP